MENNITSKKRNSTLVVVILITLVLSIAGISAVGYLGWKTSRKSKERDSAKNDTPQQIQNFNSEIVFEPSGSIVDLVKKTSPAVVTVVTKGETLNLLTDEVQETQKGIGTGFFVSDNGLLVTNQHVVCDADGDPKNLSIVTTADKSYTVEALSVDPVQDIAILKVNTNGDKITPLKFANPSSQVVVGQDVIAIGNPLGVNPGSVTKGIISGINRNIKAQGACGNSISVTDYEGMMQTDAAINSGNSGGPLINLNGEVVAVNSATSFGANNISYSIPFDRVVKILEKYQRNNGKLTAIYFGVEYTMIDANVARSGDMPQGALIRRVIADSPAAKAGVKRGDIITKIEDKKIDFSLRTTVNQYFENGQRVKVELYRFDNETAGKGVYLNLDMTLEESK